MNYIVYKHIAPNGKVYIGITKLDVNQRWKNGRGYKCNDYFYRAIKKYGWENFKHEILFTDLSKEVAEQKEIELIAEYKSDIREFGYNIQHGGNTHCVSEETKNKISNKLKGKEVLETTREKLSKQKLGANNPQYGKIRSKEHRQKISEANKGRRCKDDTKIKIGEANSKITICIETGKSYKSAKEASEQTRINASCIRDVCLGKRKRAGGYHWEYAKK